MEKFLVNPDQIPEDQVYVAQQIAEAHELTGVEVIAMANAEQKHPMGKPVFHVVDASQTGKLMITANNFGEGISGEYDDPNEPASTWYGGKFVGEGATPEQTLEFAIANGWLPADSSIEDLTGADLGNNLFVMAKAPSGRWIVFGTELKGVEDWSGKVTAQEFDAIAEFAKQGIAVSLADLKNLEIRTQVKGLDGGGTSLTYGVKATSSSSTTVAPTTSTTTSSSTTTSTSVPEETTTSLTISSTTTAPKETTTSVAEASSTTTIPDVVLIPAENTVATSTTSIAPNVPTALAETGVNHGDLLFGSFMLAAVGGALFIGAKARAVMASAPALVKTEKR